MTERTADRDLGMDRRIARRDFLNGIAIAVTGAVAGRNAPAFAVAAGDFQAPSTSTPPASAPYPPALTGLRGNFELEIRRHLTAMLGPGGFDPATDIVGLTVNRWPYGYAYTYDSLGDPDVPPERRPHVIGRQRFGQVTVANADAGAAAFTNQAIDEAHRAVQELLVKNGLT